MLSAEQRERVERTLQETFKRDLEIADDEGLAMETVRAVRVAMGLASGQAREAEVRRKRVGETFAEHPDWHDQQVADHLDVPIHRVRADRTALGIENTPRPKRPSRADVSPEVREQIIDALASGFDSDPKVADAVGVHRAAVYAVRRKAGIPAGPQRREEDSKRRVAKIVAEHPDWTNERVAVAIGGISRNTVGEYRRRLGLPVIEAGYHRDEEQASAAV